MDYYECFSQVYAVDHAEETWKPCKRCKPIRRMDYLDRIYEEAHAEAKEVWLNYQQRLDRVKEKDPRD